MLYLLAVVAIVEFLYIVYQDFLNRQEREKLQMKLMSRDVDEYKRVTEKPEETQPQEESPYQSVDEVDIDKLLSAKDNL
jgi:hypothetical protein